jgi:SAM-dependent methyltransferase
MVQLDPEVVRLSPGTEQFAELLGWIDAIHPGDVAVVDVGGGGDFYDFPAAIRGRARRLVGVDPDPGVLSRPWLDVGRQLSVEEYASATTERFDVALCVYVMEHVETPGPFLEAVRSLLVDGGSCFGVTPNLWHYFGLTSAASARLGIENRLLRRVRSTELIESYHFPVHYRCNTIHSLRSTATAAGFRTTEFRVLEHPGLFETYFPAPLRWAPRAYSRMINRFGWPNLFGTLLFRLTA